MSGIDFPVLLTRTCRVRSARAVQSQDALSGRVETPHPAEPHPSVHGGKSWPYRRLGIHGFIALGESRRESRIWRGAWTSSIVTVGAASRCVGYGPDLGC